MTEISAHDEERIIRACVQDGMTMHIAKVKFGIKFQTKSQYHRLRRKIIKRKEEKDLQASLFFWSEKFFWTDLCLRKNWFVRKFGHAKIAVSFVILFLLFLIGAKSQARLQLFASRHESISRLKREVSQAQEECQDHKRKLDVMKAENNRIEKK